MERTAATDVADAGQVIQADVIIDGQTDQDPDRDPDGPVFIITIDSLGQAQNGRDPFLGLSFFFSQIFDTVGTGEIHRTLSDRLTDGRVGWDGAWCPVLFLHGFPEKTSERIILSGTGDPGASCASFCTRADLPRCFMI